MIDHLLRAETEEIMAQLVPHLCIIEENEYIWAPNCIPNVKAILNDDPEVLAGGWYLWVACNNLDEDLKNLPDNVCRIIVERESNVGPQGPHLYLAPDITPEILNAVRLEPVFAGSLYRFREI